jgi:hypothetical protein
MTYPIYRQDFEGGSTLGTACPELVDQDSVYAIDTAGANALTGTHSLKLTSLGVTHPIYSNTADTLIGGVTFTLYFLAGDTSPNLQLFTRILPANTPVTSWTDWIGCIFTTTGITVRQKKAGTVTPLNTAISGVSVPSGVWVCVELRCNGTAISCRVVRQDTGQYFVNTGTGSWSSTPQGSAGTATTTTVAGGWALVCSDGVSLNLDNWYIGPAVPSVDVPTFTLTSLGQTQPLTAGGFTDPLFGVTWSSSNPAVATVSSSGLVTAVGVGTATITATGGRDTGQTAVATATVNSLSYTLTAPPLAMGVVNSPSGNFTVTPLTSYTGTITITPSGGGLSTPIVLTFSGSAAPQTFPITPTAPGTVTLTGTNSGTLTNPPPVTYLALAQGPLPAWIYKRALTDSTGGSLAGFVCRLALTSANFDFSLAKSDGSDLRVYDETAGAVLPSWLMDYDSVAQTATLYYRALLTSHTHNLYYGNAAAAAVSNFANVFTHGTGFDTGWGDMTTQVTGNAFARQYAKSGGITDPRHRAVFRRSQTPAILGTTNGNTVVRDFYIVTDLRHNIVTDGSGNWIGYYANMNWTGTAFTLANTYRCQSADNGLTWTNHTLALDMGAAGTYDDAGGRCGTVLRFGATDYRMWYTANSSVVALNGVGLATATNIMGPWTRAGTVVNSGACGITTGAVNLSGVPSVSQLADGTFVMVCEVRPATGTTYPWSLYGWTSPDASTGSWVCMNGGSYLINGLGSAPFTTYGCANPKFYEMVPGSSYLIFAQGFQGSGSDITTFNGQGGWWSASAKNGPFTPDSSAPIFGRNNNPSNFGEEASQFALDPAGNWIMHLQDYAASDNTNGYGNIHRIYPVTGQLGVLDSPDPTDGGLAGVVLDPGTFTLERRSGLTTHRSSDSRSVLLALYDGASVPVPAASGTFSVNLRCAVRRATFAATSNGPVGAIDASYQDTGGTFQYYNGTSFTPTSSNYAVVTDLNREVIAQIQDDGTNFWLSAYYADTGAQLMRVSVPKASIKAFAVGRVAYCGDPYTNTASAGSYSRMIAVRPYAATEPVIQAGPMITLTSGPIPLFFNRVA